MKKTNITLKVCPIFGVLNGAGREIIEENKLGLCSSPVDTEENLRRCSISGDDEWIP